MELLPSQPVPSGKALSLAASMYALRCSRLESDTWRSLSVGCKVWGRTLRRYAQTLVWRKNRLGVRSARSWPRLSRSLKIWRRIRGGVFKGWGIGWGCSPWQTTSTLEQTDRYSSRGSNMQMQLWQGRRFISAITSSPVESLCSHAIKQ